MKRQLIIDSGTFETRAALLEDYVLVEYVPVLPDAPAPGRLYRGQVLRVDPSLDGAFIEIGEALPGFLPRAGKRLHQGDLCLVEAKAIPTTPTKGIQLTDEIRLPGRYMVYCPVSPGIHVSRKLCTVCQAEAADYARQRCTGDEGLIIRTEWSTLGDDRTPFDAELNRLLEAYSAAVAASRSTHGEYLKRYRSILSVEKIARLYVAEEKFRRQQVCRMPRPGGSPEGPRQP